MDKIIAVLGCGYWGTIIANNLLNLGYKNFYIYDSNIKNSQNLKKKFQNVIISQSYDGILKDKSIKNIFYATPPSTNYSLIKILVPRSMTIFLLFGIVLFFGLLLIYPFKVMIITSTIYLGIIPLSFIHYQKLNKKHNIKNLNNENEDFEDVL